MLTASDIAFPFIQTDEDENGVLKSIRFTNDEHFNFAYDIVDRMAQKAPDKLAMLHVSNHLAERRFTYKDLSELSARAANCFTKLGIRRGDRVMVVLKRHFQFWYTLLALHKIGAIIIPASNLLLESDFSYRFKEAGVSAVICTPDDHVAEEIEKALTSYDGIRVRLMTGNARAGWLDFDREVAACSKQFQFPDPQNRPGGNEPSIMFFTSGTTAYPKITTHNFKYPLGHYVTAKYWHKVDPDGIHLALSDTGWGKALWGKIYGQWLCEAPVFVYDYDDFHAKSILQMIEKYHITTFCAPPTVYRVMVHLKLEKYDLSSLQRATTAGEALNPEIFRRFRDATGLTIFEGFGQTETTLTIGNLTGTESRPGSMGKPNPQYDVRIMMPDGSFAKVGETGEIVICTQEQIPDGLFMEYHKDPEKTKNAWHDGFYHTGDTAYFDEDGYYWYVGRTDDLIKSSGYRVGPFEIENELMKLPYILECAVTPVPDKIRGQAIKATVVLAGGAVPDESLKHQILSTVKKNLASYKWPKIIDFVDALPKTTSDKIQRNVIREKDWK